MPQRPSRFAIPCLVITLAMSTGPASGGDAPTFAGQTRPVLDKFCVGCHNAKRMKAGVDLSKWPDGGAMVKEADLALRVAEVLDERTMPPEGKPAPGEDERAAASAGIRSELAALDSIRDPGTSLIQRLTRRQYNNTIRDLLGVDSHPADAFPSDGGGGGGFDNNASTLFVPPILMEGYLAAAGDVLDAADPSRWRIAAPGPGLSNEAAARRCLEAFASRAFRRPASGEEVDRLLRLYRKAEARGDDFDSAVKLGLRGVLVSPNFLFLVERDRPAPPGEAFAPVGAHELATRLSYFLWSSTPDDELLRAAGSGELNRPDGRERQVTRMLADPKARALATDFAAQWLRVDTLATAAEPDGRRFPTYNREVRDAMAEEPLAFFRAMIRDDAPVVDLIGADYSYLNETLAKHYGVEGVVGPEFRRVRFADAEQGRGGVLGMAAILTLTSYPQRTSPVLRGKWVLEEILGTPPPPPPSMVKVLPADDRPKDDLTFRQRLEQHRKDPSCASCHAKLDPLGFGLESYDAIGRWRTEIAGRPVDASGVLADGTAFVGPAALKALLVETKRETFVRNLSARMLSYALRRGLEYYDTGAVKAIAASVHEGGDKTSRLVQAVAASFPFRHRRAATSIAAQPEPAQHPTQDPKPGANR